MAYITQCTHCQSRYRLTDKHLEAYNGQVRCGSCQQVFNARENLTPAPETATSTTPETPTGNTHPSGSNNHSEADRIARVLAQAKAGGNWNANEAEKENSEDRINLPSDRDIDRFRGFNLDLPDFESGSSTPSNNRHAAPPSREPAIREPLREREPPRVKPTPNDFPPPELNLARPPIEAPQRPTAAPIPAARQTAAYHATADDLDISRDDLWAEESTPVTLSKPETRPTAPPPAPVPEAAEPKFTTPEPITPEPLSIKEPIRADVRPTEKKRVEPSFASALQDAMTPVAPQERISVLDDEDDGVIPKISPQATAKSDTTPEKIEPEIKSGGLLDRVINKKKDIVDKIRGNDELTAAQEEYQDENYEAPPPLPPRPGVSWGWVTASVMATCVLFGQLAYQYRTEIGSQVPGARSIFKSICENAGCTVPLPTKSEHLRTEWSELTFVPDHPNLIQLSATLRNQAPYPQAYPHLELSLKDGEEHLLARRVFTATDYLSKEDLALGQFNANSEVKVFMQLDLGQLKSSGYSLLWFYPS